MANVPIEVLLSARSFVYPQTWQAKVFFMSNMGQGGHYSLYSMRAGGSVPQPLLPPQIALQNPSLMNGPSFIIFEKLGKILVLLDNNGDENYQPVYIPLDGGLPEPVFGDHFKDYNITITLVDPPNNMIYFTAEGREERISKVCKADLGTGEVKLLREDSWTNFATGFSPDHKRATIEESYSTGDSVLFEWQEGHDELRLLYGTPMSERPEDYEIVLSSLGLSVYTESKRGILIFTSLFEDTYGLGYMALDKPGEILPVKITGTVHRGIGEFDGYDRLYGNRFTVQYNIDGESWLYEGTFDEAAREMRLDTVIVGQGKLANGVLEAANYDELADRFAISFSTATSPSQLYTVEGKDRSKITAHTEERILGIPPEWLSPGEDASFNSHDGMRVSARLYLPAPALGFEGKRPVVFYIHGGPQGQERPDFTWFSMPLIQFLTMNGIAVFVPNARGSTGYGLTYTKQVDHDWGGQDRLDHVHALKLLAEHPRVDPSRAGIVGRSYGGFMTLTQATRHPQLWKAAVDMFGPFDLIKFIDSVPVTWRPYFAVALADPDTEEGRAFLKERSPSTYIDQIQAKLLVIQGQNDPRVTEPESRGLVEYLREKGKSVDYLMFKDEGHDVLKFANRVSCYNRITEFFLEHL